MELNLTRLEFALLLALFRNQGKVPSRQSQRIWERNFDDKKNLITVTVLHLRSKLDAPFESKLLHAVRGKGYVLEERL